MGVEKPAVRQTQRELVRYDSARMVQQKTAPGESRKANVQNVHVFKGQRMLGDHILPSVLGLTVWLQQG